jgi:hypothetical protein
MLKDHTGHPLQAGQRATMDSGNVNWNDWTGEIVERDNELYFRYRDDGDEVKITPDLCREIEVLRFA